MQIDLTTISQRIVAFFGESVNSLAQQTGFMRRQPRTGLDGMVFLRTLVWGFLENPHASLNDLSQVCEDQGVTITPQGLDERIHQHTVQFMQQLLQRALVTFRNAVPLPLDVLQHFTAVNLVDSSLIEVPASMVDEFPGSGGKGPSASVKVQLVLEFLYGNLLWLALRPGRENDQGYRDYLETVVPNSLTIWDLGYFCLDAIQEITGRQAYWLSRYFSATALRTADGAPLDLCAYLRQHGDHTHSLAVQLGSRHRIPCRLVIARVPQEVADRRRQRLRAKVKTTGTTPQKQTLFLQDWTLCVTNVPEDWLTDTQILTIYRVRWQAELCFKLCKSYCGLDYVTGLRRDRVLTELLAKLIGVILVHFIWTPLRLPRGPHANRELSAFQVAKLLRRAAPRLLAALHAHNTCEQEIMDLHKRMLRFACKQPRRKRPNVGHMLAQLVTTTLNAQFDNMNEPQMHFILP